MLGVGGVPDLPTAGSAVPLHSALHSAAINLDTPSGGHVFEVSLKQLEIRTRYDISEELFKLTSRPFYAIFASKPFYIEQKTAVTVFT